MRQEWDEGPLSHHQFTENPQLNATHIMFHENWVGEFNMLRVNVSPIKN